LVVAVRLVLRVFWGVFVAGVLVLANVIFFATAERKVSEVSEVKAGVLTRLFPHDGAIYRLSRSDGLPGIFT